MKRSEAYHILGKMWEGATSEQAEALSIAQNDIEFVDLLPDDMCRVVFCTDCKKHGNDEECPLLSMMAYTEPTDFCSYGERRKDNAAD
jgi:hypothetical protein